MSCEECHKLYVERIGIATPCVTCPKPLLEVRNDWIWELFIRMTSQSRTGGMGGFVGLDYGAIEFILKAEQVPQSLWSYILEKLDILTEIGKKYWNKKEDE